MKKLITAVALLCCAFTYAQKEGSVTYVMTMEGLPPEQASMMGDMETKIVYKDKKTYTEMNSMMVSYKTVTDDNGSLTVMDQMGNKYFTRMTKADMDKMAAEKKEKDPKIEYTSETKSIAGYECKKAIVTGEGKEGEVKMDVWYSEKVPYISQGGGRKGGEMFKGLKGMPMEFSVNQGPMKIKMVAKEVSFEKVPDSIFTLSTEGYTEKTLADLQKGGGK
jgi:GLPGLI family protein